MSDVDQNILSGVAASAGIAIGRAYRFEKNTFEAEDRRIARDEVAAELKLFDRAILLSERDLRKIAQIARDQVGTESANVFEAQVLMLHDPAFRGVVEDKISNELSAADFAVQTVMEMHRRRLEKSESRYLRERSHDIGDVQHRLIRHLQQGQILSRIDEKRIVVAESLSAADLILFTRQKLLGCVLDYGAETAHVSIMARALGIPVIVGLHGETDAIENGVRLIVDGLTGRVVVEPTEDQIERYRERQLRYEASLAARTALAELPAVTTDGTSVKLMANLEFLEEIDALAGSGAEGVGLFRTEMLFFSESNIPDEETQAEVYESIVLSVAPEVTTFRLFDLGGDKIQMEGPSEQNPELGWRGMRVLLDQDDIMYPQLRALLRARAAGPIKILLPMVTDVREVIHFRSVMQAVISTLRDEGYEINEDIPVGSMIEIPGAAIQSHHFARACDFLSIGTNDLTQYVLAVDRANDRVAHQYDGLHPAVLRLIKSVVEKARDAGADVSICGELASDVEALPVLVGLGLTEFSAVPGAIPRMKQIIRGLSRQDTALLVEKCLKMADAAGVRQAVNEWAAHHPELGIEREQ